MKRTRQTGFTLLELLVALAVFSLVSVMAYSGLRTVLQSKQQTDLHAQRIQQLQTAVLMMERDFSQFVSRPVRDEFGDESEALQATDYGAHQIAFTHAGYANPTAMSRSTLQRVAYGIEEERLMRFSWPMLDRAQNSEPYQVILLDGVRELSLRYYDKNGEWQSQWPPANLDPDEAVPLPKGVEVTLALTDMGEIRRLFPLFDEAMPTTLKTPTGNDEQDTGEEDN